MNCLEFRRILASDPHSADAAFVRHRQECERCADAAARALAFETTLRRALAIDPPAQLAESILLNQATRERRQRVRYRRGGLLALAAAAMLAVGVGLEVQAKPLPKLAVDHLSHEAAVLTRTAPVSDDEVRKAFAKRGVTLHDVPPDISFVACCPMGRYLTVHMVMPGASGPVTVLYLANDHTQTREDFQRDGWQGRSIPMDGGTLVLLAENSAPFDHVEAIWRRALKG
ncbi:MAG TPA: DUF3379 family protein [Rudaea sp.]